jgi:hypothetical protein
MLSALALYECSTCGYIWGIYIPKKKMTQQLKGDKYEYPS